MDVLIKSPRGKRVSDFLFRSYFTFYVKKKRKKKGNF